MVAYICGIYGIYKEYIPLWLNNKKCNQSWEQSESIIYSHIYFEISNLKLRDILIAFPLVDVIPWSFESMVVIWKQNIWQFAFGWSVTDSKNHIRADQYVPNTVHTFQQSLHFVFASPPQKKKKRCFLSSELSSALRFYCLVLF